MTREEAEEKVRQLSRAHPDSAAYRWLVRQDDDGGWLVVKVSMPSGKRLDPVRATTEARPKPPQADDPRIGDWQRVPPYGAG